MIYMSQYGPVCCGWPDAMTMGRAMASRLVRSTLVRALAGIIMLRSYSYSGSLLPGLKLGTGENSMLGGKWTSIPSTGGGWGCRNTPSCLMLQKPQISSNLMSHLARMQTLLTFFHSRELLA